MAKESGKSKLNIQPKVPKQLKKTTWRSFIIYAILGFLLFAFLAFTTNPVDKLTPQEPISRVIIDIRDNKAESVEIDGDKISITLKDGQTYLARKEEDQSLFDALAAAKVDPTSTKITVKDRTFSQAWIGLLTTFLPLALMIVFFLFIFRQAREGASSVFSFGQSRAKQFNRDMPKTTFKDVAGVDEAKQELQEVVDFLKHPEKYRAVGARTPKGVLLVGPAGTGKCVTGDTMVWTNKGLMEIREVPRYYFVDHKTSKVHGAQLASLDLRNVISKDKFASHWFDLGEQKTIKVKVSQGYTLEGTPEHPIVVMTTDGTLKFRKLADVREGDFVAIQYGREMFGNLTLVDEDTAYLMGILTGDGNMSHASRIGLTSIDDEIINFFKEYVAKHYAKSAITPRGQSYLVASWDFKRYLYQMGMSYLLSFDKIVPATILQAPKAIQVAFLQGLFDTDASVGSKRADFEYTTVSERMAKQIQMMLLNIGVVASLNLKGKKENGYYRSVYRITLTGSSLVSFGKLVGFRLSRKQKLVEGHIKKMGRVNTNIDIIPHIATLVDQSWKVISSLKLSNEKLSKTIDKVRRRMRVTRQTLAEYVSYASSLSIDISNLEYLRSLLEANLFFSPVIEKSYRLNNVYDFTVPETHSFLSNGFVSHNTLLARAVAGEAGVPFYSVAGSEFMEMLVGVGAARVRDLFLQAKKSAPAIIFIDEIESIGRMRGMGFSGGHDEREQTLNQILVEMDGFSANENVMVMAATNRPDMLDSALTRPGRFDRRVALDLPDIEGRKATIKIHMKGKPFAKEVDIERLAKRTVGFSGADLANMLNEAAILTARGVRKEIENVDLEEAATKVKLGPQRKRMQSKGERRMTAYHESGHAIVAHFLPNVDPVHRISIVSRGGTGGHTLVPPSIDRYTETKTRLLETIATLLGGRAAEELVFGEFTTGASSDLSIASKTAREMVVELGMSDLGPTVFAQGGQYVGFANMGENPMPLSPELTARIDKEISKIIDAGYKKAKETIVKNRKKLDIVADTLLEKETLERDEFEKLVGKPAELNGEYKIKTARSSRPARA